MGDIANAMSQDDLEHLYEILDDAREGESEAQKDLNGILLTLLSELHEKRRSELSTYHRNLSEKTEAWLDARLADRYLILDPRAAAHAKWWAAAEWVPEPGDAVWLYILASLSLHPKDAVSDYVGERYPCSCCGTRYRVENFQVCVLCSAKLCYDCHNPHESGHYHNCGGELV